MNLKRFFKSLNYKIDVWENIDLSNLKKHLQFLKREFTLQKEKGNEYKSLIIVIMLHGSGELMTLNNDDSISFNDFKEEIAKLKLFEKQKFPILFIFQVCRLRGR